MKTATAHKLGALACALAVLTAKAGISGSNKEVWFSAAAGSGGSGTIASPYAGTNLWTTLRGWSIGDGTYDKSSNVVIRLLPGTYNAYSGLEIPSGSRLIGSGMHSTVVYLSLSPANNLAWTNTSGAVISDLSQVSTNKGTHYAPTELTSSYVSDLTVDGAFGDTNVSALNIKTGGVCLWSTVSTIERVRAVNFGAADDNSEDPHDDETFALWIRYREDSAAGVHAATIRDCIVEGAAKTHSGRGGYATSILMGPSLNSNSPRYKFVGLVTGNKVLGNTTGVAYGVSRSTQLFDNSAMTCAVGVNCDTWYSENVSLHDNHLLDVGIGIKVSEGSSRYSNYSIRNNLVEINNYYASSSDTNRRPTGIRLSSYVTNMVVSDNIIQITPDDQSGYQTNWYGLYGYGSNTRGVQVVNNQISLLLNNSIPASWQPWGNGDNTGVSWIGGNAGFEDARGATLVIPDAAPNDYDLDDNFLTPLTEQPIWISWNWAYRNSLNTTTKNLRMPDPRPFKGRTFKILWYKVPSTSSFAIAVKGNSAPDTSGAGTAVAIWDVKTDTFAAPGTAITIASATTAQSYNWLEFTSIGHMWVLTRK